MFVSLKMLWPMTVILLSIVKLIINNFKLNLKPSTEVFMCHCGCQSQSPNMELKCNIVSICNHYLQFADLAYYHQLSKYMSNVIISEVAVRLFKLWSKGGVLHNLMSRSLGLLLIMLNTNNGLVEQAISVKFCAQSRIGIVLM